MSSANTVLITVGVGVAINAAYDAQNKPDETTITLLAGAATAGLLVIVGSASNEWEIVEAIAVAYLVGSFFLHATKIKGLNTLFGSKAVSHTGGGVPNRPTNFTNTNNSGNSQNA